MTKFLAVYENFHGLFEEGNEIGFGKACLIALIAILIVFVVLILIIGSIKLLQICVAKLDKKKAPEKEEVVPESKNEKVEEHNDVNVMEDDDMMAAVLVATIDYAEENAKAGIKKDIKLKSVKRIG